MSFVGRLARGLAAGLGNYLTQEGLARLDEGRRARILKDREQALANFLLGRGEDEGEGGDPDALDAWSARQIRNRINRSIRQIPLSRGQ